MQQLNLGFSAIRKDGPKPVITANPFREVRVPLGFDQRQLAELSRLSVSTTRRMKASEATARGDVTSPVKRTDAPTTRGGEPSAIRSFQGEQADK
jgi:hypothetical protein